MMRQTRFFTSMVACVCVLVLLAACGGVQGSGGNGSTTNTASTPSSSQSTPTSTSTDSQSATPTATSSNTRSAPTPTPTQGSAGSLEQIDWSNFTYTFSCFTGTPVQVKMKNGQADQNGVHYTVQKPVFGDLNGDGHPEAVIIYHCEGGGTSPQLVYVYTGTEQQPTIMAYLPGDGSKLQTVNQAAIVAGILQLTGYGYSDNVPLCCPDLLVTTTYKWNGSTFTVVTSQSIKRVPGA